MSASVRLEKRTLGFMMLRFFVRFHCMPLASQQLHLQLRLSSSANCFDPKQSGVVSLSRCSSSRSTTKLMFVFVDVDPLMRLSLATCLTGTHQPVPHGFLLSRRFHYENIKLLQVTFQNCSFLLVFIAPNLYMTCSDVYLLTIPFRLSNLYCHSNLCCLPSFPFLLRVHLLHNRTWPNDLTFHSCSRHR